MRRNVRAVEVEELRSRARSLVDSPALTYRQRVLALAALAEESLGPPMVSPAGAEAFTSGVICELAEGNAPDRPRYLLPGYGRALNNGSGFVWLEAARDFYEEIGRAHV